MILVFVEGFRVVDTDCLRRWVSERLVGLQYGSNRVDSISTHCTWRIAIEKGLKALDRGSNADPTGTSKVLGRVVALDLGTLHSQSSGVKRLSWRCVLGSNSHKDM